MSRQRKEPPESAAGRLFSDRLNHLFATRPNPATGKPYSLREVANGTGDAVSSSYLSTLRGGKVGLPGMDKIEALARFFGVPVTYFMSAESQAEDAENAAPAISGDDELTRALNNPLVREIALQAGQFGPEEWQHMLAILQHQVELQRLIERRLTTQQQQAAPEPRDTSSASRKRRSRKNETPPERGGQHTCEERQAENS